MHEFFLGIITCKKFQRGFYLIVIYDLGFRWDFLKCKLVLGFHGDIIRKKWKCDIFKHTAHSK